MAQTSDTGRRLRKKRRKTRISATGLRNGQEQQQRNETFPRKRLPKSYNTRRDSSLLFLAKKRKRKLRRDSSMRAITKKQKLSNLSEIPDVENKSNELIDKKCVQGISVVWFDPKNSDQLEKKARLRSLANYMKIFGDIDLFTDYLFSIDCSQKKLYVILPGSYGKTIVPFLHDHTQAEFIYIFCKDKERHEEWVKLYSHKIRGIFIDKHELVAKLTEDVEFYTKMTPMSVISANQLKPETSVYNLNEEEASFMWHQLLIEILRRMPLTSLKKRSFKAMSTGI